MKKISLRTDLLGYIVRRLLYFIPTLFVISLASFALMKLSPGDPVQIQSPPADNSIQDIEFQNTRYEATARSLNLHLPAFYFDLHGRAYPDTLYKYIQYDTRAFLSQWISKTGNWPATKEYYDALIEVRSSLLSSSKELAPDVKIQMRSDLNTLLYSTAYSKIDFLISRLKESVLQTQATASPLNKSIDRLQIHYQTLKSASKRHLLYIPTLTWHGTNNQYHQWLSGILRGDLGKSYINLEPVNTKIAPALSWTLTISLSAILLSYLIAIPIGVYSAKQAGSRLDRGISLILFALYSLPVFWIATLCLLLFTNDEYGMDWFDGVWTSLPSNASWWEQFSASVNHLVLPVLCVTYPSLAFIARQMRGAMRDVLGQLYITAARARGLSERTVIWHHAFRNALFPLITIFAGVFPRAVAGSVIVEFIFNIPGMGWHTLEAITEKDWPVVFAVMLLSAVLTMIGILVSDLLYAVADPRIAYKK